MERITKPSRPPERLPSFFTLLDEVTIARSRKHIKNYYSASIEQLGGFPERKPPLVDRHGYCD